MSRKPPVVYLRAPIPAAYPEHANYVDRGCHLHAACLTCPLPECVYDRYKDAARVPNKRQQAADNQRERMRTMHAQGYTIYDIVAAFNVSERTVQRAINGGGA